MMTIKRWGAGVSVLAIAGGFLCSGSALATPTTVGSTGTAGAVSISNSAHPEGAAHPLTRAPGCFHANGHQGNVTTTVYWHNGCNKAQRVKFVIDNARDSECFTARPNEHGWWKSADGAFPQLAYTELC